MTDDQPRLTLADCHAMEPRYCNKGNRAMCERHGIDWAEFRENGVLLSEIEHIDDAMLHDVVALARRRQGLE